MEISLIPKRVLVCGGREFTDIQLVVHALLYVTELYADLDDTTPDITIVHGDALGADTLCARVAEAIGFKIEAHPANWKKYNNSAGPKRNQEMLDTGVDLVVAFPGGVGTADMVRRARAAGVEVKEF